VVEWAPQLGDEAWVPLMHEAELAPHVGEEVAVPLRVQWVEAQGYGGHPLSSWPHLVVPPLWIHPPPPVPTQPWSSQRFQIRKPKSMMQTRTMKQRVQADKLIGMQLQRQMGVQPY